MQIVDYRLVASGIHSDIAHRAEIRASSEIPLPENFFYKIIRRTIDARAKTIYYVLRAEVSDKPIAGEGIQEFKFNDVSDKEAVHIIGAGPCGYFAALELILLGYKPIVLERGKDVRHRRRDLKAIQQDGEVNPDSNYCFGEGGAGTYSDGKLYTRSSKRGSIKKVLDLLVFHGAHPDILVDVHPHIGSNKLPDIVSNIRKTIEQCGGQVLFNSPVLDIFSENGEIQSIRTGSVEMKCKNLILATGHSARDIYRLFFRKGWKMELKDFAVGLRIEHPQSVIDEIQYRIKERPDYLPAASYSLACNIGQKGVFSFCMCPGGLIIPAATAPGEIVVNGMSLSRRDSPFANSGMVSAVDLNDFKAFTKQGVLQGMAFQASIEQSMFNLGDGSQRAPAQSLMGFLKHKKSVELPGSSYIPGLFAVDLQAHLPGPLAHRLTKGLEFFCAKMPKYLHQSAVLVATESRTSAPVRIPRDANSLMHPEIQGLYPAGEGAGYAGGILSAAMDGQKVAQAVAKSLEA